MNRISINKVLDVLFCMILLLNDAGTMGIFPINVSQVILLLMLAIMCFNNKKFVYNKYLIYLFVIIGVVTFTHRFDFDSIKSFGYLFLSLSAIYMFIRERNWQSIAKMIYDTSAIFSVYGVIQEILFILGIRQIAGVAIYNTHYVTSWGLLRAMSFYAEPAHLSPIIGLGIIIGLAEYKKKTAWARLWKNLLIMLCALLSQSTIVYGTVCVAVICFIFVIEENEKSKMKYFIMAIIAVCVLLFAAGDVIIGTFSRLDQFRTLQTDTGNDLSALAIITNFNIAVAKMKDGYLIGTGLDSHRLYYDYYINLLYSKLFIYLNYEDAASLYTRIFSEFGIIGIMGYLVAIIRRFLVGIKKRNKFLLCTIMMLSFITLRNGNYANIYTQMLFLYAMFCPLNVEEINYEKAIS